MSAMTMISGLAGRGRLETQIDRHAAGREAAAHGLAKVHRSATTTPATFARQAYRQFATQRSKGPFELGHLVAIGVHDVEVFGQRLAHRLGERLGPAVLDQIVL
jgi:hypothetical protein